MENNIRVSLTTKLFKDIIQMNIDFSEFELPKAPEDPQEEERFSLFGGSLNDDKNTHLLNNKIWIRLLT
jgi:hypothetical protein